MAEPIYKWTDYYGGIRRVKIDLNDKGEMTGYSYFYVGASFVPPYPKEIPDGFWDTAEEAVAGIRKGLELRLSKLIGVGEWLKEKTNGIRKEIGLLRKRIPDLEKEVVLESDRSK